MVSSIHHTRTQTQTPEKTGPLISDLQKNQTLNVKNRTPEKKDPDIGSMEKKTTNIKNLIQEKTRPPIMNLWKKQVPFLVAN